MKLVNKIGFLNMVLQLDHIIGSYFDATRETRLKIAHTIFIELQIIPTSVMSFDMG